MWEGGGVWYCTVLECTEEEPEGCDALSGLLARD